MRYLYALLLCFDTSFTQIAQPHSLSVFSDESPLASHCYSRLLKSVHSAIERGKYSTKSAMNQLNILRIGE